ncbi:MAG: DUF3093 domain-containing protein [Actinomycetes bacterium]
MEYRERLTAPAWYWLVGIVFGATTVAAVGLWLGPSYAVAGGLATVALVTLGFVWIGRTEVAVEGGGLRVGESLLEWEWVGEVEALDAAATRARLGVDADPRAHVVQRAWIPESVMVTLSDPADPHQYWLVSSRRPVHLVEAIRRAHSRADS